MKGTKLSFGAPWGAGNPGGGRDPKSLPPNNNRGVDAAVPPPQPNSGSPRHAPPRVISSTIPERDRSGNSRLAKGAPRSMLDGFLGVPQL